MPVSFSDYLKAGIQHFDSGGIATPTVMNPNQQSTTGLQAGQNITNPIGTADPSTGQGVFENSANPLAGPAGLTEYGNPQSVNSVFSGAGSFSNQFQDATKGFASGLTPQNTYTANAPLDVGNLQNQIYTGQQNLGSTESNQDQLAKALLAQSQGQGPNPAQDQLNQSTNQNIAQSTGMIASQKGISPALAARLASENQGSISQQSAGQGAVMNSQQQLNAQQGLGNLYGQQANENLQNISTSGQLGNQSGLGANNINAGVAAQNAAATQNTQSGLLGGISSGLNGSVLKNIGLAKGGVVPNYDDGGSVDDTQMPGQQAPQKQAAPAPAQSAPSASDQIAKNILAGAGVPIWANGMNPTQLQGSSGSSGGASDPSASGLGTSAASAGGGEAAGGAGLMAGAGEAEGGASSLGLLALAARGGKIPGHLQHIAQIYHPDFHAKSGGSVPAMLSPGEKYLSPEDAKKVAMGDKDSLKNAQKVPGKAKVKGDSLKNDTVKAEVDPGGFVIPRHIMQSKDPEAAAAKFVADKLREKGGGDVKDDFKTALKQAISGRKGK